MFTTIMKGVYIFFSGLVFSVVCGYLIVIGADTFTKIVIIPFLVCGVAVLINGIITILKGINMKKDINKPEDKDDTNKKTNNKLNNASRWADNLYLTGFSIFWFGFLIFADYYVIKNGQWQIFAFSLIFWMVGIFMILPKYKKK